MLALVGGLLVPYFWNPAQAMQKTNAEMTRLITSFHGYISRMRLLGLGFAHAYSQNKADLSFLTVVSNAAGSAIND